MDMWGVVVKDRRPEALGGLSFLPDEILCSILTYLTPRDIGRLSCVSSVMYIFCNEEPLWMTLCLQNVNRQLEYKGSWKKTTLHQLELLTECPQSPPKPLQFDGFYSLFLYRRLYRCYTSLDRFSFDNGNVVRKDGLSLQEFSEQYDGQKPVLISGLADNWPARSGWTIQQLLQKYGDKTFRISQRSTKKITMMFKDYVSYTQTQHDEDPLYVFDEKFGEVAPGLLKDYSVPHLFQEDFFDILNDDDRPPFRWLIIGPERSGASWHVDPALTSAWNTLLCGRKRWALYPPGKVPLGVTVHVNEDDGDVHIDTPSSLQWWLDFYPLLSDEDKPIECTQLPGETIFVPSGWWHCVLNLETSIAVTQNFVNTRNFEFVCLDMAPGYRHKGVCRAGILALDEESSGDAEKDSSKPENRVGDVDLIRKEKRIRMHESPEVLNYQNATESNNSNEEFSYDIKFLSRFLDKERDHYRSEWSSSNVIGQRNMREWLHKLWLGKPELRELWWKGACLALNADRWYNCMMEICSFHKLSTPSDEEKLPVGTGSNPVYISSNSVIKLFVEGGLEASMYALGTELQFYHLLHQTNSPLKDHIPGVLASGILFIGEGIYTIIPWDGKGVPELLENLVGTPEHQREVGYHFGIWNRKHFELQIVGSLLESGSSEGSSTVLPYIILERCRGKIFADLRNSLSWDDSLRLAEFLGEQLQNLHILPLPPFNGSNLLVGEQRTGLSPGSGLVDDTEAKISFPPELSIYIRTLNKKKENISSRLAKWGDPIPSTLIEKVGDYLPDDFGKFFDEGYTSSGKAYTWIHSDVMDDNVLMRPAYLSSCFEQNASNSCQMDDGSVDGYGKNVANFWHPCHIIDFSDLSVGHPICDLIPIYLDVFRGDTYFLKRFLKSYKLPIVAGKSVDSTRFGQASYLTMCFCILHDDNVLGAIFSLWKELRMAKTWEEVEEKVWGDLNQYKGFC
ncbi:OLC1v1017354C1 [Oldenlandia corymbosa var. corymbosa]|uniref:OLC1v1017354C1 n=1 Tax=Oldenlandia corymbosa var. corymbosa TaxID=529605 RepID=A0AAV1E9A7_OLDCO|nr:OLC1v1017354C1 [Oldenlandia corymbosa var. corymbosa]